MIYRLGECLDMVKTVRARKAVKLKACKDKCLLCEESAASGRRGLCDYHYMQFDTEKRKQPVRKRVAFDMAQVQAGRILASRRGKTPRSPNPFAAA